VKVATLTNFYINNKLFVLDTEAIKKKEIFVEEKFLKTTIFITYNSVLFY